jgi:hypothetical protein
MKQVELPKWGKVLSSASLNRAQNLAKGDSIFKLRSPEACDHEKTKYFQYFPWPKKPTHVEERADS